MSLTWLGTFELFERSPDTPNLLALMLLFRGADDALRLGNVLVCMRQCRRGNCAGQGKCHGTACPKGVTKRPTSLGESPARRVYQPAAPSQTRSVRGYDQAKLIDLPPPMPIT